MLFNSFSFIIFFVVVTTLYFILPHRYRWFMLLAASCLFYMYFIPIYILILVGTIVIDYYAGIAIESCKKQRYKKYLLTLSLASNIGILAFFKYYNFFIENINGIAQLVGWNYSMDILNIVLPVGLSFHTFQAMSYTIEVYRGKQHAEKHFGIYALYVMYYPQLVAGPIERPQNVLPQLHAKHNFNMSRIVSGLKQMLIGFFKKLVIADTIAGLINPVYENINGYQGITVLIAAIFFSFQIYCDFSGYSDIAQGASRVMGIELMQNFKAPFLSKSVTEFWRRWHISLSSWLNDYLFTPFITAQRAWGKWAVIVGLFLTFFLSGLWHGAGWTFIVYGCLHGLATIYEFVTKRIRKKIADFIPGTLYGVFTTLLTFLFVCFSWIFFRASSFEEATIMLNKIVQAFPNYIAGILKPGYLWLEPLVFNRDVSQVIPKLAALGVALLVLFINEKADYNYNFIKELDSKKLGVRWAYYSVLIYMILFFGVFHNQKEFIYFQF